MRAGDLDQVVVIQQKSRAADVGPGKTISWTTLATDWAQVIPLTANERIQAQGMNSSATYRVVMRYRTDVTAANRLTWLSTTLQILGVLVWPREGRMELMCGEVP